MAIDFTALNNACKLYYSMDNADVSGSTILDLTPNNNDGTLMNSPTTGVTGILNEAISFDGVDDYVTAPHSTLSSSFGFSFWTKRSSISSTQFVLELRQTSSGSDGQTYFQYLSDNTVKIGFYDTVNSWQSLTTEDTYTSTSKWYHNIILFDNVNGQMHLYIDEVHKGTINSGNPYEVTTDTNIGRRVSGGNPYNGLIDEFIIIDDWTTAGTAQEIATFLYNSGAPTVNQQYPFSTNIVYEIKGQVTLSGTATQGATLRLYDQTGGTYEGSTTTDSSGNYLFENLTDTNEYHVSVEYDDGTTKYNDESKPYVTPTEQ